MRITCLFSSLLLSLSSLAQSVAINGSANITGSTVIQPPVPPGPVITNTTLGLVNWWKFDENSGTSAADSSDSSTGTLHGTPYWTNGVINSALHFLNAGSDYVSLSANTGVGTGPFTVSAWVFRDDASKAGTMIGDSDNDITAGYIFTISSSSGNVTIQIIGSSQDIIRTTSAGGVPVNTWTHVLATWDGTITDATKVHIYTNSVEQTYTTSQNGSGVHAANSSPAYLGKATFSFPTFNGIMDDPRVWNRVLSAGEITNMFQWRGEP